MIRICGFDPGTRICGYGIIDIDPRPMSMMFVECGTLETGPGDIQKRLRVLHEDAVDLLQEFKPDAGAIECAYFGVNPQSTLRLAESRGVLLQALSEMGIHVDQYQPSSAKLSVTGSGKATKKQVQIAVMNTLHLASSPKFDATDALAIAICCARRRSW